MNIEISMILLLYISVAWILACLEEMPPRDKILFTLGWLLWVVIAIYISAKEIKNRIINSENYPPR